MDVGEMVTQYGIGIVCILYFMFRDYKFTQQLTVTLASLQTILGEFQKRLNQEGGEKDGNMG